jgi:hypothetical protein
MLGHAHLAVIVATTVNGVSTTLRTPVIHPYSVVIGVCVLLVVVVGIAV